MADNLHLGVFGGWNGFKFVVDKEKMTEEQKKLIDEKSKMQNTGIRRGAELGWRIFVMNKFFIDPTLSIGYLQKTTKSSNITETFDKAIETIENPAEKAKARENFNKNKDSITDVTQKFLPIHLLLKTGYAINDALSLYGIVGNGINVSWSSSRDSKKTSRDSEKKCWGDFIAGAGLAFYFQKYISVFAEYRYVYTFINEDQTGVKGINSNRVVGGLQFNF